MVKTIEQETVFSTNNFDEVFPIINPSELVGHKLLEHKPRNWKQEDLLNVIREGIDLKMPAFRVPCMDPSVENGKIVFKPGNRLAVGYSNFWWVENCKEFMPSKNSRLGTRFHLAFLMLELMKYLVEEKNYSVEDA